MNKKEFKQFVDTLTPQSGVYRMYDKEGKIIYIGKAKSLRNRVSSYISKTQDSAKTRAMVKNIASIEVAVTDTEADALLLESNLIKEFRPRYNVVFRDDKSYPYLYLSTDQEFPRLNFYRGSRKGKGKYYGPYPSAGASRRTLNLVQKLFKLRQCDDSFFRNRSRPCLQYQIKRCSAPCVGFINRDEYEQDIKLAKFFLDGKNDQVIQALNQPMMQASVKLDYEKAARYRDQIAILRQFQESQHIISDQGEADIIACSRQSGQACIQVFVIRGGRNLGNKSYFHKILMEETAEEIIEIFIKQQYLGNESKLEIPVNIYVSHKPKDIKLLQRTLSEKFKKKIHLRVQVRGEKSKLIKMAMDNAMLALKQRLAQNLKYQQQLEYLREFLDRDEPINRIECFDISHLGGDDTVGSCIVYSSQGPVKSDYRRFNVEGITASDDYEAMEQLLNRHYTRKRTDEGILPDLILVDGGKGQVTKVKRVLKELQFDEAISLLGIAKGPSRKAGLETLVLSDGKKVTRLQEDSVMLHLLQEIRDEAHRFAITGQRQKRKKKINKSPLENIEGIGNKRRQNLILHFGGMQGIKSAGLDELSRVPGISKYLAKKIYDTLHNL